MAWIDAGDANQSVDPIVLGCDGADGVVDMILVGKVALPGRCEIAVVPILSIGVLDNFV